jgi:hypothetical protein
MARRPNLGIRCTVRFRPSRSHRSTDALGAAMQPRRKSLGHSFHVQTNRGRTGHTRRCVRAARGGRSPLRASVLRAAAAAASAVGVPTAPVLVRHHGGTNKHTPSGATSMRHGRAPPLPRHAARQSGTCCTPLHSCNAEQRIALRQQLRSAAARVQPVPLPVQHRPLSIPREARPVSLHACAPAGGARVPPACAGASSFIRAGRAPKLALGAQEIVRLPHEKKTEPATCARVRV